jgi:glycosyltransferase involved in cell wall biosynthesis
VPGAKILPAAEYESRRDDFDLPLYQMGNSEHHEAIYDLLLRYPGVVVLHEVYLHHFVQHHTVGRGDWLGYGRELAYEMGSDGRRLGRAIHAARTDAPLFAVPLNQRVVDAALGLIVHSQYAADRIRRERPGALVGIAPAPVEMRPGRSRRADLALPDDVVLFGSYGQLTAEKQIEPALRAFRRARETQPNAHYLLAGEAAPDVDVAALIDNLDLNEAVHHVGYVGDLNSFVDWIHTADVVINLRQPTVGETSAVALRALAAGKALIVFDHGWYSELPDTAAAKIPPGDEDALQAAMERLAGSAELRRDMGQAAWRYARHRCLPAHTADAYVDFLRQVLAAGIAYG